MSRRGENIYKRKDGRWEGRYIKDHVNGKIKYGYVFAKTYKEVKSKLASEKNNYEQEKMVVSTVPATMPGGIFSTIAEEWFSLQKPQWKQSSTVKYRNILCSYLYPVFAEKYVSDITRDCVMSFSSKLLLEGGIHQEGLSPKTVTGIISVLKNIFEYASQIKGYDVADIKGISVKQPQKPMRILSRIEQQRLSTLLYDDLNPCNLGILICLYTGIRIGEVCALKWKDISFDEQYMHIYQTMQRLQSEECMNSKTKVVISAPKSDCSIRRVPIPDEIFKILKEHRRADSAYLLTGTIWNYIEPRTMQNRFKSVSSQCGIEDANFHALRHTFATRCVELGFDIKSLSEILGHASVNITLNRYVHPSMELKQKNMNMLSKLFSVK